MKLESKKTLELTQFVDADEIDVLYFERPISSSPPTIWPRKRSSCCARRCAGRRRSGWASSRCAGREYVVSLKPCGRGMVLETLRYADEVNKAQGYFRDIPDAKPDADLLDLATTLIDKKTAQVRRRRSSTTAMSMR